MMKKITLLVAVLAALTMNAQNEVWSDNFNDEDISDWTTIDADGDDFNWGELFAISNDAGEAVTPVSLISRSWSGAALTPDNWVISPAIDLSTAGGTIEVSYITQVAAQPWDEEKYSIHVGTSNDIDELINAENSFTETLGDEENTGTPVSHTLDISNLAGVGEIYIAFRHWDCTDQDFISVDDLTVTSETLSIADNKITGFDHFLSESGDLQMKANSNLNNIEVFNITGQLILKSTLSGNSDSINIAKLSGGIYIAKVDIEGSNQSFKIVKK